MEYSNRTAFKSKENIPQNICTDKTGDFSSFSSDSQGKEVKLPFKLRADIPEELREGVIEKSLLMYNTGIERGNKPWELSDFEIGTPLGRGRFGRVYLARDKVCHAHVAIKMLFKSEICKHDMAHQVIREIEIQSRMKHPNIIQLFTYFSDEKRVFLVMEYAAGGELYKYLQNAPMKRILESLAAKYTYQVADATHFCQVNNIIHRDIKPENLLLSLDGNIKLTDFGLSVYSPSDLPNNMCGTVDYLAPEMIAHNNYNNKVDNWCIGVLCYEFLVGEAPFHSETSPETLKKIKSVNVKYPPYMCLGAKDLISKLLRRDPSERISLPELMKHSWIVSQLNEATH